MKHSGSLVPETVRTDFLDLETRTAVIRRVPSQALPLGVRVERSEGTQVGEEDREGIAVSQERLINCLLLESALFQMLDSFGLA